MGCKNLDIFQDYLKGFQARVFKEGEIKNNINIRKFAITPIKSYGPDGRLPRAYYVSPVEGYENAQTVQNDPGSTRTLDGKRDKGEGFGKLIKKRW